MIPHPVQSVLIVVESGPQLAVLFRNFRASGGVLRRRSELERGLLGRALRNECGRSHLRISPSSGLGHGIPTRDSVVWAAQTKPSPCFPPLTTTPATRHTPPSSHPWPAKLLTDACVGSYPPVSSFPLIFIVFIRFSAAAQQGVCLHATRTPSIRLGHTR
jgi:hypothetical protein